MTTPRSILVADDNLTIQRMASEMLSQEGLEVTTVANGMAAIKKLSAVKPLVVVADVDMPGKDGYEVCEYVKSQPDLSYIRVLLVVSDTDPYDQERGALMQADGVIKKPFDRQELVSVVMKYADQAQALRPPEPEAVQEETNHVAWGTSQEPPHEESTPAPEVTDSEMHQAFASAPAIFSEPNPLDISTAHSDSSAPPEVDWPVGLSAIPLADEHFESPELVPEASSYPAPPPTEWQEDSAPQPAVESSLLELTVPEVHFSPPVTISPENDADLADASSIVTSASDFQPSFALEPAAPTGTNREDVSPVPPLDISLITSVIHGVVSRMAPPALSPELVQDLEQRLKDEIISEIESSRG